MSVSKEDLYRATTLITGFPGFLTRNLLIRLMRQAGPHVSYVLLVEKKHVQLATSRLEECRALAPDFTGSVEIVVGDITQSHLGIEDEVYDRLVTSVEVVWHLAAIYDLAVGEDIAYRINVLGTFHVLDFCVELENLYRFNYISTCYVSGVREGLILETELDCNQNHNNYYESTKFWAEVEVQRRSAILPTVIFRPAIVVGDSNTGETDKYDGPYYLLRLFEHLPKWLPLPSVKKTGAVVNLVPVNFVVDAMAYIGLQESASGVYQLADHRPLTVQQILAESVRVFGGTLLPELIPTSWLDKALSFERMESLLNMPHELVEYFSHLGSYDTLRTRSALEGSGIHCPDFGSYVDTLVDYMKSHPNKSFLDDRNR